MRREGSVSLSERKRSATRERIAAAAAQLVSEQGLSAATIDRIAETAEIGRATFFRYFASKEDAVAEGVTANWLDTITAAIATQPARLTATEAVVAAFGQLADGFDDIADQIRDLATLTRSSAPLTAWTLNVYVRYENAIADLIAPRLPNLQPQDPRPRLIGALAMASVRIALDDWLIHGGALPLTVHTALTSIEIADRHRPVLASRRETRPTQPTA